MERPPKMIPESVLPTTPAAFALTRDNLVTAERGATTYRDDDQCDPLAPEGDGLHQMLLSLRENGAIEHGRRV